MTILCPLRLNKYGDFDKSGGWKPEAAPAEPLKNKKYEGCPALDTNCKT
jgi:hypothetical protein